MTYEISIVYHGANHYLVEADTPEAAERVALQRYYEGDNGEQTGAEWEEIEHFRVEPVAV